MTFNIRFDNPDDGENRWAMRRELVNEVIASHEPDDLRRDFPEYGELGVGRDDGRTNGEYAAILYRRNLFTLEDSGTFWFSDSPAVPGSRHWGNHVTRICTWGRLRLHGSKAVVTVFNMHLDHESQHSRERSVLLLADTLRRHLPSSQVILLGDLNAAESNRVVRFLAGSHPLAGPDGQERSISTAFVDTYRRLHATTDSVGTYHGFRGIPHGDKIDYIFVSSETEVLSAHIERLHRGDRYPSDHFPVTAVIRVP
jgi:endonuclease/exonuclease/phosphatase family metal-dependent hydrolase